MVVGVVDDVFDVSVTQAPEPTLYLPWAQNNNSNVPVAFVIRTAVDPASIAPAVRGVLKEIDGTLPLRRVQPLEVFVTESTAPERFRTMVLGIIAMLGLCSPPSASPASRIAVSSIARRSLPCGWRWDRSQATS